jgi:hypothetical protein
MLSQSRNTRLRGRAPTADTSGRYSERAGRVVPGGTGPEKADGLYRWHPPSVTSSTQPLQPAERNVMSTRAPEVGNNSAIPPDCYVVVDEKPSRALLGEAVQPCLPAFADRLVANCETELGGEACARSTTRRASRRAPPDFGIKIACAGLGFGSRG